MSIVSLLIQTRFSFHSTVTVYAAIDAQSDIRTLFSWFVYAVNQTLPFFFLQVILACETTEMKPPAFKTSSHQFLSTWGVVSLRKKEKKLHLKWKEKKFRELVDYLCRDGVDMQYMQRLYNFTTNTLKAYLSAQPSFFSALYMIGKTVELFKSLAKDS